METIRDICCGVDCGKLLPIVNKKYYLCEDCNFKRTHDGKSKQQVYGDRAKEREERNVKEGWKGIGTIRPTKGCSRIAQVSKNTRYSCSDGSLVSQYQISVNLKLTYAKIDETRLPFCEGSGKTGVPLSHSHTISQARCKQLGKAELIWDEDNIFLEEFEAPTSNPTASHNVWELGNIEKKTTLVNFDKKLEYIKLHDIEQYMKLVIQLEDLANKLSEENYEG